MTVVCLALLALAACGRGRDWRQTQAAPAPDSDAGYVRPPQVLSALRASDGGVILRGQAAPNSRVRLQAPGGAAYGGTVQANGDWTLPAPTGDQPRVFGISEDLDGRIVQGEGYVAVLPRPGRPAALLRAGGGALVLGDLVEPLRITAIDFDAGGGALVSGLAHAGLALRLIVDGAAAGEVKADAHGRFTAGLPAILKPGQHQISVQAGSDTVSAQVAAGAPGPISGLPYHGLRQGAAWRVDWVTPGGGVQTTLILDPPEPAH
ncbi:MAG: hypothetical protein P4L64_07980 [Caulobacteraceae bacterium]|nr:hypothetical protein [Caulobacteraceae bacterium]